MFHAGLDTHVRCYGVVCLYRYVPHVTSVVIRLHVSALTLARSIHLLYAPPYIPAGLVRMRLLTIKLLQRSERSPRLIKEIYWEAGLFLGAFRGRGGMVWYGMVWYGMVWWHRMGACAVRLSMIEFWPPHIARVFFLFSFFSQFDMKKMPNMIKCHLGMVWLERQRAIDKV